jgi:hypothetical protein
MLPEHCMNHVSYVMFPQYSSMLILTFAACNLFIVYRITMSTLSELYATTNLRRRENQSMLGYWT